MKGARNPIDIRRNVVDLYIFLNKSCTSNKNSHFKRISDELPEKMPVAKNFCATPIHVRSFKRKQFTFLEVNLYA